MDTQKKIYSAQFKNKNKGLCASLMGMGLRGSNGIELVGQGTYVMISFAVWTLSNASVLGKRIILMMKSHVFCNFKPILG